MKLKNAVKRAAGYVVKTYRYYSDKRFTTVAGTLVYFFLMSLAPFLFWLTMFFGEVDLSQLSRYPIFDAVLPILTDLQQAAGGATGGAGIILIVTTLYSSTNFFYHLRRSGEIIYGVKFKKGGIKLRFASLGLIGGTLALTAGAITSAVAADVFLRAVIGRTAAHAIVIFCRFAGRRVCRGNAQPVHMSVQNAVRARIAGQSAGRSFVDSLRGRVCNLSSFCRPRASVRKNSLGNSLSAVVLSYDEQLCHRRNL